MLQNNFDLNRCISEGPETALEKHLVEEFLKEKGYRLEDLHRLPVDKAIFLMKGACLYASLKLAEIESKLRFRDEIRGPT